MIAWLFSFALLTDSLSASPDSLRADTLREVVVMPLKRLPIEDVLDESLKRQQPPHVPTISEVLEKISPGLNDKIMYPFAVKERRREKRKKQYMKTLEDYSKVKTFNELLREAYEQQLREDSLSNR